MEVIKTYLTQKLANTLISKQQLKIVKDLIVSNGMDPKPVLKIFVKDPKNLFDFDDFKNVETTIFLIN